MEIKREHYLQMLRDRMHNGMIKIITGIRRSGKSYLLFHLFRNELLAKGVPEDHIISLSLNFPTPKSCANRRDTRLCHQ